MDALGFNQLASRKAPLALFGFPRSRRLLSAKDYKNIFDKNDFRASHKKALIIAKTNDKTQARLGLVFGKKSIPRAVDRNRLKRIAREQFRLQKNLAGDLDIIVIARPALAEMDNQTFGMLVHNLIQDVQQQQMRKQKNDFSRS